MKAVCWLVRSVDRVMAVMASALIRAGVRCSPQARALAAIASTTSMPSTTSPKLVCLPSSQGVGTWVMKNCEPLVPSAWPVMAPATRSRKSFTVASATRLREMGATILEAGEGELASHLVGKGRLPEPEEIVRRLEQDLEDDAHADAPLRGRHLLITSGPTYERIDPVRFIGNYSSGRMGKALAEQALRLGARVTFVTGPAQVLPSPNQRLEVIRVESAEEMLQACLGVSSYDVGIFCAAVADYRVANPEMQKVKREQRPTMTIDLVSNPDIAALMGERKEREQVHIGFALETRLDLSQVQDKMKRKNFDLIVANTLEDAGAGFGTETNRVTLLSRNGSIEQTLPLMKKEEVALEILKTLPKLF